MNKCNLCNLKIKERKYEDNICFVVDTKNKKGHNIRIMAVSNTHTTDYEDNFLKKQIISTLKKVFRSMSKGSFIILLGNRRSEPHLHLVASDLEGEDMELISTEPVYFIK